MARSERRRPENVAGPLYVDDSCIDCDTCRWMAPEVFDREGAMSRVHRQPEGEEQLLAAHQALLACPTSSIGTARGVDLDPALQSFPVEITRDVFHVGFHEEASFGAASYLVTRPEGNLLVDTPRFIGPVVSALEARGGVDTLLLTHIDDVASHDRFAKAFGARRVMHAADVRGGLSDVEVQLTGSEPVALADDLMAIPVPGHTPGSLAFLFRDEVLFSGDHLAFSHDLGHLYAFRSYCRDWREQTRSMERLAAHRFSWVLPGHGRRCHLPPDAMREAVGHAARWMAGID